MPQHTWDHASGTWIPVQAGNPTPVKASTTAPVAVTEAEGYTATFSFTPAAASHNAGDVNGGRQSE